MRVLLVITIAITLFLATPGTQAVEKPRPKYSTPEECFRAMEEFQAKKDFRGKLGCMTEGVQFLTLGMIAIQLEVLAYYPRGNKGKEAEALLEKYGANDIDITEMMQKFRERGRDPFQALIWAGTWVERPEEFLKEAAPFVETAIDEDIKGLPKELEKIRQQFAEWKRTATSDQERTRLHDAERRAIEGIEKDIAGKVARRKERNERQARKLVKVEVKGDTATAIIDGTEDEMVFLRIDDGWLLALAPQEGKLNRPSKRERIVARLEMRGTLLQDLEQVGGKEMVPIAYECEGDGLSRRVLTDGDLKLLSTLESIHKVSIEKAAGVTDAGIASLSALKELKQLRLADLAVSSSVLDSLSKLKMLERLELVNIDVSDESLQKVRQTLPGCKVIVSYSIGFKDFSKSIEEVRDKTGVTMVMLAKYPAPLSTDDKSATSSETRDLFRLIRKNKVQLLNENPYFPTEQPEEWKKRPHLKPNVMPQLVIFPKGKGKPLVLERDITPQSVLKALTLVLDGEGKK